MDGRAVVIYLLTQEWYAPVVRDMDSRAVVIFLLRKSDMPICGVICAGDTWEEVGEKSFERNFLKKIGKNQHLLRHSLGGVSEEVR